MCVCVWRCGGGDGGGGVCLPPVANSKFFTYIISKTFSRRIFDCQYSFNNSM